jgi:hypothetical protein
MRDEILNLAMMTTEERLAEMYRLGREGVLSRREIAMRLGMNRNNVCRLLWVAGLTKEKAEQERQKHNERPSRKEQPPPAVALPKAPKAAEPPAVAEPSVPKDDFAVLPDWPWRPQAGIGILELTPTSCRWIVASPWAHQGSSVADPIKQWLYCGKAKAHGSYCAEHAARVYVQR